MSAYDDAIAAGARAFQENSDRLGVATTTVIKIQFMKGINQARSRAIELFNDDMVVDLLYSIDGGTKFQKLAPRSSRDKPYRASSLQLKTSSGDAGWYLDAALEQ